MHGSTVFVRFIVPCWTRPAVRIEPNSKVTSLGVAHSLGRRIGSSTIPHCGMFPNEEPGQLVSVLTRTGLV